MRHIISFYSHSKPKLVIRSSQGSGVEEFELSGQISLELSFNRYCIGYARFDKSYPCPDEAVSDSGKCPHCRKLELSCASCRGDECLFGHSECLLGEHLIYLASFGELVKAGVTRKERIKERLIEQGADFGVVIAKAKDGFEARAVEALIQHQFGFRNAVRTSEKFKLLGAGREISKQSIEIAINKIKQNNFPGLEPLGLMDLSPFYPKLETKPVLDNLLEGEVLGARGNLLFLEREGPKVIDMKKNVGRYITR
ncbi:MAG: DUF2797 domain-containing protein [Candidatus Micrarchaeota archaeon]